MYNKSVTIDGSQTQLEICEIDNNSRGVKLYDEGFINFRDLINLTINFNNASKFKDEPLDETSHVYIDTYDGHTNTSLWLALLRMYNKGEKLATIRTDNMTPYTFVERAIGSDGWKIFNTFESKDKQDIIFILQKQ